MTFLGKAMTTRQTERALFFRVLYVHRLPPEVWLRLKVDLIT